MRTNQAKVRRRTPQEAPVQVPVHRGKGVQDLLRTEESVGTVETPENPLLEEDDEGGEPRQSRTSASMSVVRPVRSALPLRVPESTSLSPEIHYGILLRRARERRGLTVTDVVRITRISERWLPALEEARLDLLPASVFVAGYIRAYARVVGLDEGDLVDRYQALVQQRAQQALADTQDEVPQGQIQKRSPSASVVVGCTILLLLLGLLALAWYFLRH